MPRQKWTPDEVAVLRRSYATTPTPVLAEQLGRTLGQVYTKAHALGLHKTTAYMQEHHGPQLRKVGRDTRFKAGHQTWNKGLAYQAGGRSAETQFKPGRPPQLAHNYRPIGSTRVMNGYLEQKVTDDQSLHPVRRWAPVHRLVWEAEHGPVPPGHVVVFLPGKHSTDPAQITLEVVELITRQELVRRNTIHRYPRPLRDAMLTLGRLKAAITRKERSE